MIKRVLTLIVIFLACISVVFSLPDNKIEWLLYLNVGQLINQTNQTNQTINQTVNQTNQTNNAPLILSYYPKILTPKIAINESQLFNVSASDPEGDDVFIEFCAKKMGQTETYCQSSTLPVAEGSFSYSSPSEGDFIVSAEVSDTLNSTIFRWNLTVSDIPVADKFNGNTTNFSSIADLSNASNIVIEKTSNGKINFGGNALNLSKVIDIDNYVKIENNVVAIDTQKYPQLNKSATLTFYNLPYSATPKIYYSNGFTTNSSLISTLCPDSICSNIKYNATTGTLTFDVAHFSSFMAGQNNAPTITSSPVTAAFVNESYSYDVDATDPEDDTLSYLLLSNITGMKINSTTGLITWIPTQKGNFGVNVRVSDGQLNANQSFTIAIAEGSKLAIVDLDVVVDGKSEKKLNDGDKIGKKSKPESNIEFKLKVENLFSDKDNEIKDIEISVEIEDIDDGENIDENSNQFDLEGGENKKETISLTLPRKVDEGNFDVNIKASGEDNNGKIHEVEWVLTLEVEKERHDLVIDKASLSIGFIDCLRTSSLDVDIANYGRSDEDDVMLEVKNSELGINEIEEFGLDEDDDMAKFFTINLSNSVPKGDYNINVDVYSGASLEDSKAVQLTIAECKKEEIKKEESKEEVLVNYIPKKKEGLTSVKEEPKENTIISFVEGNEYITLLAIAIVILMGLVVFLAGYIVIMIKR